MAEWEYNMERWAETRVVEIGQDPDGMWRWWRTRTGPEARVVASCVSGGYDEAKWAYRNAVKENVGLEVPVPEGVEPMTVVTKSDEPDAGTDEPEPPTSEVEPPPPSS